MEEENGLAVATKPAAEPDARSIISMRNIWKTYQMGTEQLHALRMFHSTSERTSTSRSSALRGRANRR
ncbi:MAG: hypothetical protein R2682_02235 [Pyrinomonadaceae bacterium]